MSLQHPVRLRRRSVLAGSAALSLSLLGGRFVSAQDSPIIEPIGPESTVEPQTIEPDTALPPTDAEAAAGETTSSSGSDQYFAQTGHNLGKPFLDVWLQFGGLDVFGAPLSELRYITDLNESHQTFETMNFRFDPDQAPGLQVLGLALEDRVVASVANDARRQPGEIVGDGVVDPVTGFEVREPILSFWNAAGGQQLLGSPRSVAFSHDQVTTQVFDNAVIDAPANGTIGLHRLGTKWVQDNKLEGDRAFLPSPPSYGETKLVQAEGGLRLRNAPNLESDIVVILPDNGEFIAVAGSTGEWIPGYVDGHSGWVAAEFLTTSEAPVETGAGSSGSWDTSVWQGVALGETNVRTQPNTTSASVRMIPSGEAVRVVDWVRGEEVVENSWIWAQLEDGNYVFARNVGRSAPVAPIPVPDDAPWEGKWMDIHLTQQLMTAYEGRTPIRTIVITTGMPEWETPTGYYAVNWRVENETMTSGAIGAEYHYKLENVLYTQYFTDRGHALHYAWWRTPETIGRPGSHGCINMLLDDSEFMWNWGTIGTGVYVRI